MSKPRTTESVRDPLEILEAEDNISVSIMLLEWLDKCLKILSDHEKMMPLDKNAPTFGYSSDLIQVARAMSRSGETFDGSESISQLTERVWSKKDSYSAELDLY